MRVLRFVPLLVLAASLLCSAAAVPQAAQPPDPPNLAALEKAAEHEGVLDVAWDAQLYGGGPGAQRIVDGIAKKWGVHLKLNYSAVDNGARYINSLAEEVRAGQTASSDIMFTVPDGTFAKYVQVVDYRKYVPGLPDAVMFYGHRSAAAVTQLEAFEYNTTLVPKDKVPKNLSDFLKPEWKGKIATSPYQGGQGSYLGFPEVLGHAGMLAFYQALSGQLGGLTTCGKATADLLSGEYLFFGVDCGDQSVRMLQRQGRPLGLIYPKDGVAIRAFAPAVPLTAAHPNAAKLFIAYLLTRDGQQLLWDVMGTDNYRIPGSHSAALVAALRKGGAKIVPDYGNDAEHPELNAYTTEINKIVNGLAR